MRPTPDRAKTIIISTTVSEAVEWYRKLSNAPGIIGQCAGLPPRMRFPRALDLPQHFASRPFSNYPIAPMRALREGQ